jgi:hypothetical protein
MGLSQGAMALARKVVVSLTVGPSQWLLFVFKACHVSTASALNNYVSATANLITTSNAATTITLRLC